MRCLATLAVSFSLVLTAIAGQDAAGNGMAIHIAEPLQKTLATRYGSEEAQVLQQAVSESVARAMKRAGLTELPQPRTEVLLSDARPTHPTRHQQAENPGIDPVQSRSLGGATLSAVVRDAAGRELERVSTEHYAASLAEVSVSLDPWADARLTIDRFADQLVRAYRRHAH
jgi:hypothetical protein